MSDEIKKWLYDILEAIKSIMDYLGDTKKFEIYEQDKKLRRAIEREIEIIGEAVNRIQKENDKIEISNARQIIATRNRVAHAYDAVNNAIIWGIVINHLPHLQIEVEDLLNSKE